MSLQARYRRQPLPYLTVDVRIEFPDLPVRPHRPLKVRRKLPVPVSDIRSKVFLPPPGSIARSLLGHEVKYR